MSRMKIVGAAAAAFFGVTLVASAGIVYPVETTPSWFDDPVSSLPNGTITSGANWNVPSGCEASKSNALNAIVFDADVESPLKYTPSGDASGLVALVNVTLDIDPNVAEPTTNGLELAQAALTVVTNTSLGQLDWWGLVKDGTSNRWERLSGNHPTEGQTYDVRIVVDNRAGEKKVQYSVGLSGSGSYKALYKGESVEDVWFDNPRDTSSVTSVAFAGAGKVASFSGNNICDAGATVSELSYENNGYDFTNGTISATVEFTNSSSGDHTATLTVFGMDGAPIDCGTKTVTSESLTPSWAVTNLAPGEIYGYAITVKSGDDVCVVKTNTFFAANSNLWFAVNSDGSTNNIAWQSGKEATYEDGHWTVSGDAAFDIVDTEPGSNAVSRVDTKYSFDTFIDSESLEPLDEESVGGIVAVEGGSWRAFTGSAWAVLTGGVTPNTNIDYVVRAEFDYVSATHRVRYFVKKASETAFVPLKLDGNDWIALAKNTTTSLQSVEMSGKGSVTSIEATVADKAVVEDVYGKKFATVWDAINNGTGPFRLLTKATLVPTGAVPTGKRFTIVKNGFSLNESEMGKWTLKDNGDGTYTLTLNQWGATYLFY